MAKNAPPNRSPPGAEKGAVESTAPWRATRDGVVVACRLTPKGGRDAIEGAARLADGTSVLLARVRAAPEDGRANEALCALIAARLDLPTSRVRLAAGAKSRLKQVAIAGDPEALIARLRTL
jgi:uncharacterized protein YggU (UPF0235/DUF167 family)